MRTAGGYDTGTISFARMRGIKAIKYLKVTTKWPLTFKIRATPKGGMFGAKLVR
jgi:hypothetical protein